MPSMSMEPSLAPTYPACENDFSGLLNDTIVTAGFDLNFDLELGMSSVLDGGLLEGFGLRVNTWGAMTSLAMDQVSADYIPGQPDEEGNCNPLFSIRDSTLDLCLDLRSKGVFFATMGDVVSGSVNTSMLVPDIAAPLSGELNLEVEIANTTVLPM